ncbi:MAG: pyridoxamine 5'-phosphate oxidase family protein [Rhodocyclales bacterium]|nr:pyridoxamine 5'-phosphate oxidase family protein [Rhodocyclales bacterium]
MSSRLEILVELLHHQSEVALATHSVAMPGYPYATAVAFATDERHRPLVLISHLAEHTQNLAVDARASLAVARSLGGGEIARASLVGELLPLAGDDPAGKRYLRFHPAAARFLELGDFRFHRFEPKRIRIVGGFGQAGWLDGRLLVDAPHLALDEEETLLAAVAPKLPAGVGLLGIDAYGADLVIEGTRTRKTFARGPVVGAAPDAYLTELIGEKS